MAGHSIARHPRALHPIASLLPFASSFLPTTGSCWRHVAHRTGAFKIRLVSKTPVLLFSGETNPQNFDLLPSALSCWVWKQRGMMDGRSEGGFLWCGVQAGLQQEDSVLNHPSGCALSSFTG